MSSFTENVTSTAEIETFRRRKIAIIPFLLSGINLILIWSTKSLFRYNENINAGLLFTFLSVMTMIHLLYTATLLLAPRFLYRGTVWIKTLPWIISSACLFTVFFFINSYSVFGYVYCILGFILQLIQYIVCVLQEEPKISFIFKPFEKQMIPNFLAKIDLTDPNSRLDTIFGPPLAIPSSIPGQSPAIIRYGSQAVKIQPQQPIQQQSTPYYQHSTPASSSVSVAEELPPAYAPPIYEMTTNYSDKSSNDSENQYDMKK